MSFRPNNADHVWFELIQKIMRQGLPYAPRGKETRELLGVQTQIDMRYPIVTNPGRKAGYKFMAAEAAWILSGDNRVSTISPYSRHISTFSDDGETFFGAYGPKIKEQLYYVASTLAADPDSRQAVINIWRENPRAGTKDVPCSLSVQFLIRNNKLHCQYTMRSSDAWLGWVYDVFNFTMLAGVVLLELGQRYPQLELGLLTLTAGSQHIYETNYHDVAAVLTENTPLGDNYFPFNPRGQFQHSEDLIAKLWLVANGAGALAWAREGWC